MSTTSEFLCCDIILNSSRATRVSAAAAATVFIYCCWRLNRVVDRYYRTNPLQILFSALLYSSNQPRTWFILLFRLPFCSILFTFFFDSLQWKFKPKSRRCDSNSLMNLLAETAKSIPSPQRSQASRLLLPPFWTPLLRPPPHRSVRNVSFLIRRSLMEHNHVTIRSLHR